MSPGQPSLGLDELERRFKEAFARGDDGPLDVIGYGEISSVVRWQTESGPMAAKRLPNFSDREQRRRHVDLMKEYIASLAEAGVDVLPTSFHEFDAEDGACVAYALQELVDPQQLAAAVLLSASPAAGEAVLGSVFEHTAAIAGHPLYGLDTQLSNWVITSDGIRYLDITTPFIRDEATGRSRMDTRIFVASLPWLLRWPVQRFLAAGIVAEYFELRTTLLNAIANLHKERAHDWILQAVEVANRHLDDPITVAEVDRYYSKDQRLWAILQRLRRADRWWQLKVRRRPYPVLLPGRVDR